MKATNSAMSERQQRWLVATLLLLLPLIYFFPAVKGEYVLVYRDSLELSLPLKTLLGRMLAQGTLPLWNPYAFSGMPLMAGLQAGVWYPPNWSFALFSPRTAMNFIVITSYHLALIGTYLFARKLTMNRIGAMIAAICFTFGGFLMAQLDYTNLIHAMVWLPWIMLALEGLYQNLRAQRSLRATWGWITLGAGSIALQLFGGTPQANYLTILVAVPYWLFSLTVRERALPRMRLLAASAMMALTGVLLSLVQLLPARELQREGERASITYAFSTHGAWAPRRLLTLLFPWFFGAEARSFYQTPLRDEIWAAVNAHGYIGLAGLLLVFVALLAARQQPAAQKKQTWFWLALAVFSITLSFGHYLPFRLNELLYQVPVHNWFRYASRHLFQASFALSILAGFGTTWLATVRHSADETHHNAGVTSARRVLLVSCGVLATLLLLTALAYVNFHRLFSTLIPAGTMIRTSLTDAAALMPLLFFVLSVAVIWWYWREPRGFAGALLLVVLMADLMIFGAGLPWYTMRWQDFGFLTPPATIEFIKNREPDLNAFRLLSYSATRFPPAWHELAYQNLPEYYGVSTLGGYDPMSPLRMRDVAGSMDGTGAILEPEAVDTTHQGFNLLNVKYLLRYEASEQQFDVPGFTRIEGVPFRTASELRTAWSGGRFDLDAAGFAATEIALITYAGNSTQLPQGTVIARLRVHKRDGQVSEFEIQMGRDTTEWAFDRPDVRATIKHKAAPIAQSFSAGDFYGHNYLARFRLPRTEVDYLEFEYARPDAALTVFAVTLRDETTGQYRPLLSPRLPAERWRKLQSFGSVAVYENLKRLPRAWFVSRLQVMPLAETLRTIRTGQLPDGSAFDPASTALLEQEDFGSREIQLPQVGDAQGAMVTVTQYAPNQIELSTRHTQPGFLVLSELYYRGWEAWIDGRRAPVERVNHTLRGLSVPPGEHRITFAFRSPPFRQGVLYFLLGLCMLAAGNALAYWRERGKSDLQSEHQLGK